MGKFMGSRTLKSKLLPKNVKEVVLPVTVCGWLVGMGIIECPTGTKWPVTSFLYSLILLAGYGMMTSRAIKIIDAIATVNSRSGKFVLLALFYGNAILNVIGTVLGWMRIKKTNKLIATLERSERMIEGLGISHNYGIMYRRLLFALITQFVMVLTFMVMASNMSSVNYISDWDTIISAIVTYYSAILVSIGDVSFITFVRIIGMRFEQLNDFLKTMSLSTNLPQHMRVLKYLRSKYEGGSLEKLTNDDTIAMKSARKYHYELTKIGYMINDTFGIQALLSIAISFVLLTGLLYRTSEILLWSTLSRQIITEELINTMCWLLFYGMRICFINFECAKTSRMANNTGQIICHLHEPSTNKAFRDEIRDFTLQLTQQSLAFSACGFFKLNHSLIHGMVGSITTYLVILIQIGETPQSSSVADNTTLSSNVE